MPDISRGNTVRGQQRGLKRKNAQHVVHAAPDFFYAVCTPGPHCRADEVNGFDASSFEVSLKVEVEIRRIHTDENIWALAMAWMEQTFFQLLAYADDLAVMAQYFDIAAYGQFLTGPPGLKAALGHVRATDACRGHAWPARLQTIKQQACE